MQLDFGKSSSTNSVLKMWKKLVFGFSTYDKDNSKGGTPPA